MIRSRRVTLVILLLFAFASLVLTACAGKLEPRFSHQGRLQDETGVSVPDGNYNFRYRLFHAASGGTAVYTQTQTVAVSNGLFNSTVGLNQNINPDLFSQPVYMELTVNGEVMTPRQLLQGSPFAFSLVPGATVQGGVPITRTFQTFANTGSAFTVLNNDGTTTGGNGATIVNRAAATGAARANVAALNVIAAGSGTGAGSYGSRTQSEGWRGSYTKAADGYYAAVFESTSGIWINGGSCTGCLLSYPAANAGAEPILAGDFVTAAGVSENEALGAPILLVRKAVAGDEAIVGIATGALTYTEPSGELGVSDGGFDGADGPALSGGYLNVAVQGLVQARVGDSAAPAIGDWLTLAAGEAITASAAEQPRLAQVMSERNGDGLVWVMFNGR
jgi:hypothetical protein